MFIAPKVGSRAQMISASLFGLLSFISKSKQSISANFLNNTALPSITGLEANAPIFPNPRTAEPLVTTATKLAREVYLEASLGLLFIAIEASATPGE